MRNILLAYKERGRRDLAFALGEALARAVEPMAGRAHSLSLVPIPSRLGVARERGGDHVLRLARIAARRLVLLGVPAAVVPVLKVAGRPQDSVGLSAEERVLNLTGVFRVRTCALPQGRVVIVDDIITTGATLAEAARVIRSCHMQVAGTAVVAATLRHGNAAAPAAAWTGALLGAGGPRWCFDLHTSTRSPPVYGQ